MCIDDVGEDLLCQYVREALILTKKVPESACLTDGAGVKSCFGNTQIDKALSKGGLPYVSYQLKPSALKGNQGSPLNTTLQKKGLTPKSVIPSSPKIWSVKEWGQLPP